jgi:hypothetical protein
MNEQYWFADVTLPFHVWVRERSGAKGFRWVLRDASPEVRDAAERCAAPKGVPGSSPRT